jgi:serine/threonine-protein kinase RsbW
MGIQVRLTLPRDAARHTVTAALERAGVVGDCVDEVEVALSEACTNAYRHAGAGDTFEVRTSIGDETLTVDVIDNGAGFAARAASPWTMPSPASAGGRGMALMVAFTDLAAFDSVDRDGGSVHLVKHLRWADDAPLHRRRRASTKGAGGRMSPRRDVPPQR